MNDHDYRSDVAAEVLPGRRERLIGGGTMRLVTLRLHDGPGVLDAITGEPMQRPGTFTDLRPSEARLLADRLRDCAQHAEALRRETDR
jgi:hypothetical protein